MSISKATFVDYQSQCIPRIISFVCLESGPNDSAHEFVDSHVRILRRASVKFFYPSLCVMGAFGTNFPDFRVIRLSTSEPNHKTDMELHIKILGLSRQT
jgi:hypothetical protein